MQVSLLLVEQNPLALETTSSMLEGLGYYVVPVGSAAAGCAACQAIIFDAVMVGTSLDPFEIAKLASAAKANRPKTKVVLLGRVGATTVSNLPIDLYVGEQFRASEIDRAVRRITGIERL